MMWKWREGAWGSFVTLASHVTTYLFLALTCWVTWPHLNSLHCYQETVRVKFGHVCSSLQITPGIFKVQCMSENSTGMSSPQFSLSLNLFCCRTAVLIYHFSSCSPHCFILPLSLHYSLLSISQVHFNLKGFVISSRLILSDDSAAAFTDGLMLLSKQIYLRSCGTVLRLFWDSISLIQKIRVCHGLKHTAASNSLTEVWPHEWSSCSSALLSVLSLILSSDLTWYSSCSLLCKSSYYPNTLHGCLRGI